MGAFALWALVATCLIVGMYAGHALRPAEQPQALTQAAAKPLLPMPPQPPPYEFPAGGRELTNKYRLVALYGSPDEPALGVLGEQDLPASLARVKTLAEAYKPLSTVPVYPTFEIIATVASSSPTENGNYSREVDAAKILAWAEAARREGVYVVLDLQPGRSDFLTQAKQYETVLKQPNVGLALDPEWRLKPSQLPLKQIGSADIAEVNGVASWLSSMVVDNRLPQKLVVLHQFRLDMLPGREQLNTAHPELAFVIQMDGQGTQPAKQDTWRAITTAPPPNTAFGWKNFIDEDSPMLDPESTMQAAPPPWYISYQ
jgi:hypothetical protein